MSYRSKVLSDLSRWQEAGYVSETGAAAIAADLEDRKRRVSLAQAVSALGAILIGMAAITFVAANWPFIPRLVRLAVLVIGFSAAYGLAGWLTKTGRHWFGEAAALAGVIIFGASINLVAQMYHISGNPPTVALIWAGAALVAAWGFRSKLNFGAAILLVTLCGFWQSIEWEAVNWFFPLGLLLLVSFAIWHRWLGWASALLLLIFAGWVITAGLFHLETGLWTVAGFGCAIAISGGTLASFKPDLHDFRTGQLVTVGFLIAYAALFILHIIEDQITVLFIVVAIATLLASLVTIALGIRFDTWHMLWAGYLGFAIEVTALYFKTFGTLIGTSLFFLIAGVILIGLAFMATRLRSLAAKFKQEAAH